MEPGRVIEYIQEGKVQAGLCLDAKKGRLKILTENERELSLSSNRIIHASAYRLDLSRPRTELIRFLCDVISRRESLAKEIPVKDIWDLLNEENEKVNSSFEARSLAELCFGDKELSSDHDSAVIRSLLPQRTYFKFRENRFHPNDPETVEKILLQVKREEAKEREIKSGARWIKAILNDSDAEEPEEKEKIVNLLKEICLEGKNAENWKTARELLQRAGISNLESAFSLLVRLGIWSEDENLHLHRYEIAQEFPLPVQKESESLIIRHRNNRAINNELRDLRDVPVVTIDSPFTRDIDDGLSFERVNGVFRLGIHITDVAHFIHPGTLLDKEAIRRGTSVYLPERRIPMLPLAISEDLCSLQEGRDRPSISIFCTIDEEGNVLASEISETLLNVHQRLTYQEVDEIIAEGGPLNSLYEITKMLRAMRLDRGGLLLPISEIVVRVKEGGGIELEKRDREGPAQVMVSEAMILGNWVAARFLVDEGIPGIFKSQMAPRERLVEGEKDDLWLNYRQRKLLSKAEVSTVAGDHNGVGLEVYTNVTSPLRRYIDLIVQRQIKDALRGGKGAYRKEDLDGILVELEEVISQKAFIEQMQKRYWILKYLEGRVGQKTMAIVLDSFQNRVILLLTDYLLETTIPKNIGLSAGPGEKLFVKIKRADARADLIRVEPC
jgi:exoribonuclease-2